VEINKAAAAQTPNKRIMLMITLNLNKRTPLFKDTSTIAQQKTGITGSRQIYEITKNNRESCV
jgi:hypothetical protein